MDDYTSKDMVANILFDSQITMARGLICKRKGSVMNWAFFATWKRKEQVEWDSLQDYTRVQLHL
jgi:hypothetical protein